MAAERPRSNEPQTYRQIGPLLSLGIQFVAAVLICLFAGRWLDEKLDTEPAFTLVGVFFGIGAGFYHFFRSVLRLQKPAGEEENDSNSGSQP